MAVSKNFFPLLSGSGPTMSKFSSENLLEGIGNCPISGLIILEGVAD